MQARCKTDSHETGHKTSLRKEFTRQFYRKNHGMFILSAGMNVFRAISYLVISLLLQMVVDLMAGSSPYTYRQVMLFAIIALLFSWLASCGNLVCKPRFLKKAMTQYKEYIFARLSEKSIGTFSRENTGKYISALTNDALTIETSYMDKMLFLPYLLVSFFGALSLMLWFSPILTVIAILFSLLPLVVSIVLGRVLAEKEKMVSHQNEKFVGMVKDLLSGFSVIKSFKAEKQARQLFSQENNAAETAKLHRRETEYGISVLGEIASDTAQFGVFLTGAWMALAGRGITVGTLILFVQLMNFILSPIREIPPLLAARKASCALVEKIALSLQDNIRQKGKYIPAHLEKGITLQNLSFAYEEDKPVLQEVDFTFEAGKSYALVGGSGSGKSTLLNLLMGSSEQYTGSILFDDHELQSVSSDSLYELLTLVQQNVFIFNDTIRNNVTMFSGFEDSVVADAIQKSGLSDLIAARGEDYICGENGNALSGGEKQRISIARALLRGAPVMLIDEATAALDAETAAAVTSSILDMDGLTRIVVTHRLEESLLRRYDKILVMRAGKIAEKGHFADLIERKGLFYSLFTVAQ